MGVDVFSATTLEFRPINAERRDSIAILSLHRPQAANAFNGEMVAEITSHLNRINGTEACRLVVIVGTGKNFCAGADLQWMKSFADLKFEANVNEAKVLTAMYEALDRLTKPTIAVAQGAVYGGAVGLVAACDSVIAVTGAKFCLSEVRVGLIPAVILPYVSRKLGPGQTRRHMLSGRVFSAEEALAFGLAQQVCTSAEVGAVLRREINEFLTAGPEAQAHAKSLYHKLADQSFAQCAATAEAIAHVRASKAGQAGIKAFFNKQKPDWNLAVSESWELNA